MELFVFRQQLVDRRVLPDFQFATYAPEELLEVRVITDPRHPAYGQAGLFAKSTIPSNTIVTPYSGFIEVFATSCNSRTYTMGFGAVGDDYALDAEFVGNYGRFANDPRGVGTLQANLSAENRFNSRGESFTALVSRRQINAGEEILMSYGKAHRLSATPWMNVQGEPIMRPRLGGIVPFPSFRTESVSAVTDSTSASPALATSLSQRSADGAKTEDGCAAEGSGVAAVSASATGGSASLSEVDGASAPAIDPAGATLNAPDTKQPVALSRFLPDVANDLLWECTQCGMWSICEASTADAPLPCAACATPKLSGARLVSLLSSPAITQAMLLAEAGLDAQGPSAASTSTPPPTQVSAASLTSSTSFSSEHTDWPMNVPFLPWQVWDAAVPLTVLAKHSRFETQGHIFVYTVDTGLGREKRGRSVRDVHGSGSSVTAHMPPGTPDAEPSQETRSSTVARFQLHSRNADDASLAGLRVRDEHPIVTEENRTGGGSAGHSSGRSKRNALWERQGDLDSEELALLTPGIATLPLLSSSVSAYSPAHALASAASPTKLPFLEWTTSASGEGGTSTGEHLGLAQMGSLTAVPSHETSDSVAGMLTRPPLSYLLSTTQEVDRLVVLHRAAASGPSPVAGTSYSPQMALVRRRLQCMTRRLFTGKAFHPGDVVSYVGGLVRRRGDSRCRVSNSCLEIPLRFFLPPRLRHRCGGRACLARSGDSQGDTAEDATLQTFCERLDRLSLVVTNEFMYCPCLVLEVTQEEDRAPLIGTEVSDSASDSAGYEDEVDDALESCNVALVLTLDTLGSPFACAVAIKPIGAFEPLLARAQ
ncbi:conserved hypothetical protein [Leishmania mexicana MHOM/GT/2001/U1103]|uniref:SET domain-containing protein n=1 Tax=Leishmania mexicana (strain MHOM/GT/2001/U1103) TaxID=929439 RepID=E9B6B7_LEIMU|nr:conserved hypothetical protein [Leishmania mexicana MHOM/GT/2001/U1103]CBZ30789.1 conserved hypothetical protein [Leishmania mexicana MHOM/GT/2001/U1103]